MLNYLWIKNIKPLVILSLLSLFLLASCATNGNSDINTTLILENNISNIELVLDDNITPSYDYSSCFHFSSDILNFKLKGLYEPYNKNTYNFVFN